MFPFRFSPKDFSAVYMRFAIADKERIMLSFCQSVGPSYRGTGAGYGLSS